MAHKVATRSLGQLIVELAERQHGVVAIRQLRALGVSSEFVRGRARAGWLRRVHRGVYALGGRRLTQHGHWSAAVLACGDGAVLSHEAAAALWRIRPRAKGRIDVTVRSLAGRRGPPGLNLHRSGTLADGDVTQRERIAVTAPVRTIFDLAGAGVSHRELERAVDEAERLRICRPSELSAAIGHAQRRAGSRLLRLLLEEHTLDSTLTRSELEERFLALCRAKGLPAPLVNASLLDFTVDFFWPAAALIVELDGRQSHATQRAFQADRDRDSQLAVHGFRTVRFTWWDLTRRPAVVADRVRRLLD